ncbi:hypothetical protein [Taibaiella koreensis]|uniref:hypothetical protein n=1 Tax=Taibaiella koreensis TaxID=1268548 RepID=UPI000E59E2B1|nr:hypothetical protein [Taibaiella koreensis]
MKKAKLSLTALTLKKQTITSLDAETVKGGAPFTLQSCIQTGACTPTCTLDGTIASRYVSNCCATLHCQVG